MTPDTKYRQTPDTSRLQTPNTRHQQTQELPPQVAVLLYMCQMLVYWMWARGIDPDNAAIPYLTAVSLITFLSFSLFTASGLKFFAVLFGDQGVLFGVHGVWSSLRHFQCP